MENNPENSGNNSRSSIWEKLSFLKSRSFGLAVFLFLIVTLPVVTFIVQQQTRTQQRANVPTGLQIGLDTNRDCFAQVYIPNDQSWDQESDPNVANPAVTVPLEINQEFGVTFNLKTTPNDRNNTQDINNTPVGGPNYQQTERAVINWGRVQEPTHILGLQGLASVTPYSLDSNPESTGPKDFMWLSRDGLVPDSQLAVEGFNTRDLFYATKLKFAQAGRYTISFTVADYFAPSAQYNPIYPPNPHCRNGVAGWISRIFDVKDTSTGTTPTVTLSPRTTETPTPDPTQPIACAAHIFTDQNGDGDIKVGEKVTTRPVQLKVGQKFAYGLNLERPAIAGEKVRIEWGNNSRNQPASTLGTPYEENGSATNTRTHFNFDNGTYLDEGSYTIKSALYKGSSVHCSGGSQDIPVTVQEFAPTPPPQHTQTSCNLNVVPYNPPPFETVSVGQSVEASIEYGRHALENEQTTINWGCSGQSGCDPVSRIQVDSTSHTSTHAYTQPGTYTISASLKHLNNGNATELCSLGQSQKTLIVKAAVGATPTPTPTGPTPTATPTPAGPTATPTPAVPTATPTPSGAVQLNFVLLIQGVGEWSGLYQEEIIENKNPVSALQTRQLQVEVFNTSNTRVALTTIPITYNSLTRRYTGSASIQPLPADSLNRYTIKIKTDGYLKQLIGQRGGPTIRILPPGSTTTINTILAGGDVINDDPNDALNILDYYNGFGPCFKKGHSGTCKNSDFNADSNVDLTDHKLIYDNIKHGIQF